MMNQTANHTESFVAQFEEGLPELPGMASPWVNTFRKNGIDQFDSAGFPSSKLEAWKYTRLRPNEYKTFRRAKDPDGRANVAEVPSLLSAGEDGHRLVFVNGIVRPDLSRLERLPDGVKVAAIQEVLNHNPEYIRPYLGCIGDPAGKPLMSLNTALMNSGVVIHVERGIHVEDPIQVIFIGGLTDDPVSWYPRNLIVLEEGAEATLVQSNAGIGSSAYFTNAVTEIEVANAANLRHYRINTDNEYSTHLGSVHVKIGKDSNYEGFGLNIGGRLVRTEIFARLEGEGGHCALNGAYLLKGREHCDNTTVIEHVVPNTTCSEIFKGVLDDASRGVFQGRIVVHKDAQGTNGHQLSNALLLSNKAEMDAKPELEIYADDVKCSHGATTGQLDKTALFYLCSRGIPNVEARILLIQSFIAAAFEEIKVEAVRESILNLASVWLSAQCLPGPEGSEK